MLARPGFAVEHVDAYDAAEALTLAAQRRPERERPRVAFLAHPRAAREAAVLPRLSGRIAPVLSVRDPRASAEWYARVFGFTVRREFAGPDGRVLDVCMTHAASGIELCLVGHRGANDDVFNEARIGLDHLELLVEERQDLDAWVDQLDGLGVPHSGVKVAPASRNAMVTLRDPDNIQLELFWPSAPAGDDGLDHRDAPR